MLTLSVIMIRCLSSKMRKESAMREFAKVSPQIWINERGKELKRLGIQAQFLAYYLSTNPHANMIGIYYLPIAFIAHETGMKTEEVIQTLGQLENINYCSYDKSTDYIWVHDMAFDQLGKTLKPKDKRVTSINDSFFGLPNLPFLEKFFEKYAEAFHIKKPDHNDDEAPSEPHRSKEKENEKNKNTKVIEIKNNNITTSLPEEWKKINFTPLESIGFCEQHLLDIYSVSSCHPSVVQESIYHFAFGLEEGRHKQYDSPLKVLIGRLRKGNAWIESNYESPKEQALRELVIRKKAEKEKWDSMVKELVDIEFPVWRKKLTPDDVKKIVPSETLKLNLAPAITATLRTHYIDNVLLPNLSHNNPNTRHEGDATMS